MQKAAILTISLFMAISVTYAQSYEIFAPEGKAIKGYDPVAFFDASKPVKGYDSLAYEWKNVTWLFSTSKNLRAFKENPEKYSPQYGGYCAYGTAQGHKSPTETDTWKIINDKLYFNYNKNVQAKWMKDQPALVEKADKQWITIKDDNFVP